MPLVFKHKEGSGKEKCLASRHSCQSLSDVQSPVIAGVGGSVSKLIRKVSKGACLLAAVLSRSIDLGTGFTSMVRVMGSKSLS